jgi:hypothetical protein
MDSLNSERDGEGVLGHGEVFKKYLVLWRNAKRIGIKAVAAVILLPCAVEAGLAATTEMMSKGLNGVTVAVESGDQKASDADLGSGRIGQGGEFAGKRGSESGGSGAKRDKPLDGENAKDANKGGDQHKDGGWWDYFDAALLGLILVGIPMSSVFMQKPNVHDERRER